jgi:archaellum component FlaC
MEIDLIRRRRMTTIIERLIELTGKLMNTLLDWPFLGFVFLLWIANRYRNQIGSFLDRRGTVPAGDISKAVKQNLEPISSDVADLRTAILDLRRQMTRLDDSESRRAQILEPVNVKIASVEEAVAKLRLRFEGMNHKELPELLTRGLDPLRKDLSLLRDDFERIGTELAAFALKEGVDRLESSVDELKKSVEPLSNDLNLLRDTLGRAQTELETFASKDVVETLQTVTRAVEEQLRGVRDSLSTLQSKTEAFAPAETVVQLEKELGGLKSTVADLTAVVRSVPAELAEKLAREVEPINKEVGLLKLSVEQLQSQPRGKGTAEAKESQAKSKDSGKKKHKSKGMPLNQ